jgi:hypothetical protein
MLPTKRNKQQHFERVISCSRCIESIDEADERCSDAQATAASIRQHVPALTDTMMTFMLLLLRKLLSMPVLPVLVPFAMKAGLLAGCNSSRLQRTPNKNSKRSSTAKSIHLHT